MVTRLERSRDLVNYLYAALALSFPDTSSIKLYSCIYERPLDLNGSDQVCNSSMIQQQKNKKGEVMIRALSMSVLRTPCFMVGIVDTT